MASHSYGAPPPPPPPTMGSIPATRLQTQLPAEAPACVQNAMMTKDKKPFTYTPGGIDLSQIKSPRMAKRISRNANSEGVTGVPKMSPLAQQPNTPGVQPPTPPCLPSGMPVQVFPCGSPQPPPPPPPQAKLNAPQNGINGNKSPERKSPQSFEPPPFGCRPEIKIPPNPMANLRPTPKPQPKDDFWVEEYRKERSKSPMAPQQSVAQSTNEPSEKQEEIPAIKPEVQKPQISQKPTSPVNVVPKRISPVRSPSPVTSRPQVQPPSPTRTPQQETPLTVYNNVAPAQKEESPVRIPVRNQNSTNHRAPSPVRQEPPPQSPPQRNIQLGSIYIPPVQDQMANRQHLLNQQTPPWMQSRQGGQKEMPEWVNRDETPKVQQNQTTSNPRERIIPIQLEQTPTPTKTPMTPGFGPQPFYNVAQQYSSVQSPPTTVSSPTYTTPYNNPNQFVDQGYNNISFPTSSNQPWANAQQNSGQRIIPISVEGQSVPENSFNVRGPVSQQPTVIRSDPRSPQNVPQQPPWLQPNQSKSFRILQKMTDTIADGQTSEEDTGPAELQQPHYSRPLGPADMNENQLRKLQLSDHDRALMNRVKNQVDQETYLHSEEDPRYRGAAIPSKAFKLLQNMTDGGQAYDNQAAIHRANPRFAQQRAVFQPNEGENQVYVHPSEQHVPEPKIYTGSAIPSRSFKMLQAMTTPENAGPGQSDL